MVLRICNMLNRLQQSGIQTQRRRHETLSPFGVDVNIRQPPNHLPTYPPPRKKKQKQKNQTIKQEQKKRYYNLIVLIVLIVHVKYNNHSFHWKCFSLWCARFYVSCIWTSITQARNIMPRPLKLKSDVPRKRIKINKSSVMVWKLDKKYNVVHSANQPMKTVTTSQSLRTYWDSIQWK